MSSPPTVRAKLSRTRHDALGHPSRPPLAGTVVDRETRLFNLPRLSRSSESASIKRSRPDRPLGGVLRDERSGSGPDAGARTDVARDRVRGDSQARTREERRRDRGTGVLRGRERRPHGPGRAHARGDPRPGRRQDRQEAGPAQLGRWYAPGRLLPPVRRPGLRAAGPERVHGRVDAIPARPELGALDHLFARAREGRSWRPCCTRGAY